MASALPRPTKRPGSASGVAQSKKVYAHTPKIVTDSTAAERPYASLSREELEVALRVTKTKLISADSTVSQLRAENQRYEAELLKQTRRLEKYLEQSTGPSGPGKLAPSGEQRRELEKSLLVRQLKTQVMLLRSTVAERELEIESMRKNQRNSKLIELTNEKDEYYNEAARLKKVVRDLQNTLLVERRNFRLLEAKKAAAGEEIRREVTKLTSGYQNILKGMSAAGGTMVSVLHQQQQGGNGHGARPSSAQPLARASSAGAVGGQRRPQSATKARPGARALSAGARRPDASGGNALDAMMNDYTDEVDFFNGEIDHDAEQLNYNLKTSEPSPTPAAARAAAAAAAGADGNDDKRFLRRPDSRASTNSLLTAEDAGRGGYVEIFVSKIVLSHLKAPGKSPAANNVLDVAFSFATEADAFWAFQQVYTWPAKAQRVFTLGRTTVMENGASAERQNPDLSWVCAYRDLQRGTFGVVVTDKAPVVDEDGVPLRTAMGTSHSLIVPLPEYIHDNDTISLPVEIDLDLPVVDDGVRTCTVTVSFEVTPIAAERYEIALQDRARAMAKAAMAAAGPQYKVGDKVEANYRGEGSYYAATVKSVSKDDGTYALRYDDGDEEKSVPAARIRIVEKPPPRAAAPAAAPAAAATTAAAAAAAPAVPAAAVSAKSGPRYAPGTRVEGLFDGGDEWWPATVRTSTATAPPTYTYTLDYDDGDVEEGVDEARVRLLAPVPAAAATAAAMTAKGLGESFDRYIDGVSDNEDDGADLASGPAVYGAVAVPAAAVSATPSKRSDDAGYGDDFDP